jgi:glycosyltransferase involved in cell wall biosynthesis
VSVLIVSNMYPHPRAPEHGVFVRDQVAALQAEGVACTVVASGESRKGARYTLPKYLGLLAGALRAAARQRFAVVHGHYLFPTGPIAWLAGRLRGSALILTVHGSDLYHHPRWARPLVAAVLRSADHVVAVGEQLAADLSARFGLPAERISVIDMGVDSAAFRALPQAEARRRLGLDPGPLLLAAGRLVPSKGLAVLLQSLADYPAAYGEARLVVLGAGPAAAGLAAQAARLGLAERVRFAGAVARDELPLWLAAADCLVHPALEEGFGLAVIEAMSCGRIVVASAVGGIPGFVVDGQNGLLVPPGDARALAAAVARALGLGAGEARRIQAAARATAEAHDLRRQARRLAGLYARLSPAGARRASA